MGCIIFVGMDNKEEIDFTEMFELLLFSLFPIIMIWITLMGVTFCFVTEISYTLGFWIYAPISCLLGLLLTSLIIENARKKN